MYRELPAHEPSTANNSIPTPTYLFGGPVFPTDNDLDLGHPPNMDVPSSGTSGFYGPDHSNRMDMFSEAFHLSGSHLGTSDTSFQTPFQSSHYSSTGYGGFVTPDLGNLPRPLAVPSDHPQTQGELQQHIPQQQHVPHQQEQPDQLQPQATEAAATAHAIVQSTRPWSFFDRGSFEDEQTSGRDMR